MTTIPVPASSSDDLRAALEELRRMEAGPRVRLALAEGSFRLAIAADTPVDEGIALLRSAVAHDPYLVKGYLHLGRLLHERGRYHAAGLEYLTALELAPASRRLALMLAESLLELGKDAEQAAEDLIRAVAERGPDQLRTVIATIRDLLSGDPRDPAGADTAGAADTGAQDAQEPQKDGGARKPSARGPASRRRAASAPDDLGDVWLAWLLVQLRRRAKPARVAAVLRAGGARTDPNGPAELALGCVLALLSGHQPNLVRTALGGTTPDAGQPTGRALAAVLDLAEAPSAADFLRAAAEHLAHDALPVAAVCALHYDRFTTRDQSVTDVLRLIDAYPPTVASHSASRELRVAALDHFAAAAWDAGALPQARLLWREALAMDPFRVPIAVNLALLAARTKEDEQDYENAWERLFELLYLLATGVGDVQLMLAERRDLHLALVRQSWQRHCGATRPASYPSQSEMDAWVADVDAFGVWLRDWQAYYVNSRLAFRSPVHLLGVARDVSAPTLVQARDCLIEDVGAVVTSRGWAGEAVFRELSVAVISDAYARTAEPVDRARDLYYEPEKARADELAGEMIHRSLVLREALGALARAPASAAAAAVAASVVRYQRRLPRAVLRSLFVERGLIDEDVDPSEEFDDRVVRLAARWVTEQPPDKAEAAAVASALNALADVIGESVPFRYHHANALYLAGRKQDAYATAVAGLLIPSAPDGGTADARAALVGMMDQIGVEEVPAQLRGSISVALAENMIRSLRASLRTYPASAALRAVLVSLMIELGEGTKDDAWPKGAAELVVTGLVDALDEAQSERLSPVRDKIDSGWVTVAVRKAAQNLVARSAEAGTDPAAIHAESRRVTRCLELARRYPLDDKLRASLEDLSWRYQAAAKTRTAE
jgi:tetratricopeptide (TPR) repeat protein